MTPELAEIIKTGNAKAAAHDRKFAKKLGISQKVAREFVAADQAKAKRPMKKKG